jgi:hypothetical protein
MLGTALSIFMLCMPIFDHELGTKKVPPRLSDLLAPSETYRMYKTQHN